MQADLDGEIFSEIVEGVHVSHEPVRILGTQLSAAMTVLTLQGGKLLLHSPVRLTAERQRAVRRLGEVAHIFAPNLFHHTWAADWTKAFPRARLHAPRDLVKKRPDLEAHRYHGSSVDPDWQGLIEEIPIEGCRLGESALYHHATGTLVVADLVHNVGRPSGFWTKTYTSLMGFYDTVALSSVLRWTAFSDRRAARRSIDRILALPIERIVVGHGNPVVKEPTERLSEACRWM